jgi:hypothetical protein
MQERPCIEKQKDTVAGPVPYRPNEVLGGKKNHWPAERSETLNPTSIGWATTASSFKGQSHNSPARATAACWDASALRRRFVQ